MVIDDKAVAINALISAVEVIETVLGITPMGVYANVRARLDILEARIRNQLAFNPDGYNEPFYLDGYGAVSISVGDGYPTENRVDGSLYLPRDGYRDQGIYVRRQGVWEEIPTADYFENTTMVGHYGLLPSFPLYPDGYLINTGFITDDGYNNDGGFPAHIVSSSSAIRNLIVTCSAKPVGAETVVITVRKNWQNTALSVTINSSMAAGAVGFIATDAINTFNVEKGDWITVSCQTNALSSVQNLVVTFQT